MSEDYKIINEKAWNEKTIIHLESDFYNVSSFMGGKSSLNKIELDLLGDIKGKTILHLQCHFGMDSISLSKLGAIVTGVDFSINAIKAAKQMANDMKVNTKFIQSDVYKLSENLDEKFDIIYTSYGVIGWLKDLTEWAKVVHHFLKPNGKLIFIEFHPVLWMYDNDFDKIIYHYSKSEAIIEVQQGSYADRSSNQQITTMTYNHGLADVLQSLLDENLTLENFQEYNYSPYKCLNGMMEIDKDKYIIEKFGDKIPMIYSLVLMK